MTEFFEKKTLEKIKDNETGIHEIRNFISKDDCTEILEYFRNLKNKSLGKSQSIDREESTKIFFDFSYDEKLKKLKKKIEEAVGEFFVNDFQPHIITSRYPLRLHADTGKNPKDIIFKNIVIPLEIVYDQNSQNQLPPNTIIFKNKWYGPSALFTKHANQNYDFIIKDINGKFVDIINIHHFYDKIKNCNDEKFEYKKNIFKTSEKFKTYVKSLTQAKRYNTRTDKHILSEIDFNKNEYDKYMSHQPFEDCKGLVLDKAVKWELGKLIYWDRCRIHSSDNFLNNGVLYKTPLALFTSKNKI